MIPDSSPRAIADRIRGILARQDGGVIEATALRLGVSEVSLRISIDSLAPYPTLDVLIAIVRNFGVDPNWLVTGEYDSTTHRAAIDEETAGSGELIARLIARRLTPETEIPAINEKRTLRLEA